MRSVATERGRYGAMRIRSTTRVDTDPRDLPQAVSFVTRAQLADQAMQSLSDVSRYVAGVSMAQGEGHRDAPVMRGNASTADLFVDGVRDDAQYLRDTYNVERIELIKGSNALAFGRGGGGGVINRVLREAQWGRTRELSMEGGSFAHARGTFDLGNALSPRAALRIAGMLERSASFRSPVDVDRAGVNPSVAWTNGTTAIRVGLEHFQDRRTTDRGIPSLGGAPLRGVERTFFGDPAAHVAHARVNAARVSLEHDDGGSVQFRTRLHLTEYDKDYQNTVPGAISANASTYALSAYRNETGRRNAFSQSELVVRRQHGRAEQTLVAGSELGAQRTTNFRETGYVDGTATSRQVSLASPTVSLPLTFRQSVSDADNTAIASIAAGFVQHQLDLGRRLQTTLGVRWDRVAIHVDNHRTGEMRRRTDVLASPRAGVVLKPSEQFSFYGSFSTSALPSAGDQFSSLDATSETLAPERFTNREVGLKWDVRREVSLTAALYRLDRTNTRSADPNVPGRIVQTGAQRSSGVELGIAGAIARWQFTGSWTSQGARIRSATTAAAAGATVPLVPGHSMALWNRLQLQRRLGVGLGLVRQGASYAAIDNRVTLPAFTRWDGAVYLQATREVRVQGNIENLLGATYFATSQGNNNILPGAPRTLRLSMTVAP